MCSVWCRLLIIGGRVPRQPCLIAWWPFSAAVLAAASVRHFVLYCLVIEVHKCKNFLISMSKLFLGTNGDIQRKDTHMCKFDGVHLTALCKTCSCQQYFLRVKFLGRRGNKTAHELGEAYLIKKKGSACVCGTLITLPEMHLFEGNWLHY